MTALYVADTTAWNRSGRNLGLQSRWDALIEDGALAVCSPVRLELLCSARSPADYAALADDLAALPDLAVDESVVSRAESVQAMMASTSQHRGASVVDLYIAAIAEVNDATLLHYDRHFDAITQVTGQPADWIAPRGTLD